jgi:hypothetical protein
MTTTTEQQQQPQQPPSQNEELQEQQQKVVRLEQQIYNLSRALQEKEIESKGLKQALRVLQAANKQQRMQQQKQQPDRHHQILQHQVETTKDELITVRTQLEEQTQLTVKLQYQLLEQNDFIQKVKEREMEYLKTITNLEIDLQMHDIHFTNYEQQLMKLEQNTMNEMFHDENTQHQVVDVGSSKTKELITKYLLDYRELEDQYKKDRYERSRKIQLLEDENKKYQASLRVLEDRLASTNKKYVSFSLSKPTNNVYRKRINYLEKQCAEWKLSYDETIKKTRHLEKENQSTSSQTSKSIESKNNENDIAHLQREIQKRDEKIALLRVEATNYQLRTLHALFENEFSNKSSKPRTSTRSRDSKDDAVNDTMTSSDGETLSDYSSTTDNDRSSQDHRQNDPVQQIQDLKEILKRKDIELQVERNRFEEREQMLVDQLDIKWNETISTDCAKNLRQLHFFL